MGRKLKYNVNNPYIREKKRSRGPLAVFGVLLLACLLVFCLSFDIEDGTLRANGIHDAKGVTIDKTPVAELVRDNRISNYFEYQQYLTELRIAAAKAEAERLEQLRLEQERLEQERLEQQRREARQAAMQLIGEHMERVNEYVGAVARGEESSDALNGIIFRRNKDVKGRVAISFDDGPTKTYTFKYLDILAEYGARASFFCQGQNVKRYPEAAQAIVESGCELGCHSYAHAYLNKMTNAQLREDIEKCKEIMDPIQKIVLFRFPYGAYNDRVNGVLAEYDMISVMWSVDPQDWNTSDVDKLVKNVVEVAKDGDIILLHEGKDVTLAALPRILSGLQEKGFVIGTVSELLYGDRDADLMQAAEQQLISNSGE